MPSNERPEAAEMGDVVSSRLYPKRTPSLRAVLAYQSCETISEALIYFMLVFSPWAFGTTQPWSIWTMNCTGYGLGLILGCKLIIRFVLGHQPPRWQTERDRVSPALAVLTVAILGYCVIAACNARAIYDPIRMNFNYRTCLLWLPHSYDRARTLQSLANYLALACFFWSVRDWLIGKTAEEIRASRGESSLATNAHLLPGRLRRLLWVVCINGILLAIEGICQRLEGSDKLLWLVRPRINKTAIEQFGPYAYRANGAQYFNLLWPLALAFWWTLRRELRLRKSDSARPRTGRLHLLLIGVLIMSVCPIISTSRAGAAVAVIMMLISTAIILTGFRRKNSAFKFGVVLILGATLAAALWLGWDDLGKRLKSGSENFQQREKIYDTARNIARDYPVFGTGPGTFESVFQLYRSSDDEYWPAQLHNDWLETLITFGWVGSALIWLAFILVVGHWCLPGGIQTGWRLTSLLWLAVAGCLLHARFDFPLQMYSILLLFLLLCAILSVVSRRRGEAPA